MPLSTVLRTVPEGRVKAEGLAVGNLAGDASGLKLRRPTHQEGGVGLAMELR